MPPLNRVFAWSTVEVSPWFASAASIRLFVMTLLSTKRYVASRFVFTFLGLAIAVFAWGLAYKLSLYDPPQAVSRQMPQAKLLSREEQPSVEVSAAVQPLPPETNGNGLRPATPLSLLIACLAMLAGAAFLRGFRSFDPRFRPQPVLTLSNLFFRPPPFRA